MRAFNDAGGRLAERPARAKESIVRHLRFPIVAATLLILAFASGCRSKDEPKTSDSGPGVLGFLTPKTTLPAGTAITVRLGSTISSKYASPGASWSGVVVHPVTVGDKVVIPAGSPVQGVVASARPARSGSRAMLDLGIRRVTVNGRAQSVAAGAEPVVAGSPRARNLGAIAGGTAAGALIGKAVGGDGHDALIGGLIGGGTAGVLVARSKGYQVELKAGTVMTFTTDEAVAVLK